MSLLALTSYQKQIFSLLDLRVNEGEEKKSYKKSEKLSQLMRVRIWGYLWKQEPLKLSERQIQFLQKAQGFIEWGSTPYLSLFRVIHIAMGSLLGSDFQFRPKMHLSRSASNQMGPFQKNLETIRYKLYDAICELSMLAEGYQFITQDPLPEERIFPKCLEVVNNLEATLSSFTYGLEFFSIDSAFSHILEHISLLKMAFSANPKGDKLDFDLAPILFSPADNFILLKKTKPRIFPLLFLSKKEAVFFNQLWEFFSYGVKNAERELAPLAEDIKNPELKKDFCSYLAELDQFLTSFLKARIFRSSQQRVPQNIRNDSFTDRQFLDLLDLHNKNLIEEYREFKEVGKGFGELNSKALDLHKKLCKDHEARSLEAKKAQSQASSMVESPSLTFVAKDSPILRQSATIKFTKHEDHISVEIDKLDPKRPCSDLFHVLQDPSSEPTKEPKNRQFDPLLRLIMYLDYSFLQANRFTNLSILACSAKLDRVLTFFKNLLKKNEFHSYYLHFFDTILPFEKGIYFKTENEMEIFSLSVAYYYRLEADALDFRFQELVCAQPKVTNPELDPLYALKDPISLDHSPQYFDPVLVGQLKSFTGSDSNITTEVSSYFQKRAKTFLDVVELSILSKEEKKTLFKIFNLPISEPDWTIEDLIVYAKKISKRIDEAQEFVIKEYSTSSAEFFIHSLILYFFAPFKRIQIEHDLTQEPIEKKRSPKKKNSPKTPPKEDFNPFKGQVEAVGVLEPLVLDPGVEVSPTGAVQVPIKESNRLQDLKRLMKKISLDSEPNFYLICQMLEQQELNSLGRSFYREFFSSVRGWIERMLKVYDPENKGHQLYDLYVSLPSKLFIEHDNLILDKKERQLLTALSRLYVFNWDLDEALVETIFCPLFRGLLDQNEEKQVFEQLFFDSMHLATKILMFVSNQTSQPSVHFVLPSIFKEVSVPSSYLLGTIEQLNKMIKERPLEDQDLKEVCPKESFSHKYIRLSKIHAIPKKIEYHLEGLAPLILEWNKRPRLSYTLGHHILYRLSMLLESALDLGLYFSNETDHSKAQHVIFETVNGRPLGFSHDTNVKFHYLPQDIQELFTKEELPFFREFANFSNSVCHYQDWSSGPLKSYLDALKNADGLEDEVHTPLFKEHLIRTKNQVLMIVCRFLSQHLESRKISFDSIPILEKVEPVSVSWRSRMNAVL